MAIKLENKANVSAPTADYPYGNIKDNTGSNNGTPVNTAVHADFHQFFARMLDQSGIVANGLPDNNPNTFQYFLALLAVIQGQIGGITSETVDLNNIVKSGFYYGAAGAANLPTALSNGGFMIISALEPNHVGQLFIERDTTKVYSRRRNGGTWAAWAEFGNTTDINSAVAAEAALRIAADAAEASARGSADTTLQTNINTEASTRATADSNEASTRASADNALDTAKVNRSGDTITGTLQVNGGIRTQSSGPYLLTKVIDIGDWNMDTNSGVNVAHGLADITKIRRIDVIIRNDMDTKIFPLMCIPGATTDVSGGILEVTTTNVSLVRGSGFTFDTTDFDSTSFNRGWVTIEYAA